MENRLKKEEYIGENKHIFVEKRYATCTPLHAHNYFEIEIILEGSGVQQINGKSFSLQRGCVSILNPSDFHQVWAENDESLIVWNIAFDDSVVSIDRLEELFLNGGSCKLLDGDTLFKADTVAQLLSHECENMNTIKPLMEYLLALISEKPDFPNSLASIKKAVLYVDIHFRESPTLEEAAKQSCLSTVYFGNIFKKTTGQTYIDYLNTRKVNCAAMLLASGLSVTDACFSSGFGSLSGFLYTFKKKMGKSPDQYRKEYAKIKFS